MSIYFTRVYGLNDSFGVSFQAKVNDENLPCVISIEALDDIDPSNRFDDTLEKFLTNRAQFEDIARSKILNGEIVDGKVFINQNDVL